MSIKVELERLAAEITARGPVGYLLTGSDDHRPHATHVEVTLDGARLRIPAGRRSARNAQSHAGVCVLWPPAERGGYSLIVDGDATVEGTPGDGAVVVVEPTFAVLHRPADHAGPVPDGACAADCERLTTETGGTG